jgi:putative membrane protein
VAAAFHIQFFVFQSILWMKPFVRKIFRRTESEAQASKLLAFNQGFYNLFLAFGTLAGVWLWNTGHISEGVAILTVSLGSMLAAALVLLVSAGTKMLRGVLIQGLVPAICLILIWRPV